ncbi:hypothetical protein ABIC74_000827 [Mucilaginibacter rubeus]|uniref:hypothetical protein n=1 Tax=Mucilaginibacter rubeus TaxID=2027860 RepID=UPI003394B6EC
MKESHLKRSNVTPEKAVKILNKHGTIVTVEEAKKILELAYNFCILSVNQTIRNKK